MMGIVNFFLGVPTGFIDPSNDFICVVPSEGAADRFDSENDVQRAWKSDIELDI
jgi:hypothetical protein